MAFVPFTKDEQPTMAAFNEKFEQAIEQAIEQAFADGVKIEVGSYVGTGTVGSANPTKLTFGFEPKAVMIVERATSPSNSVIGGCLWLRGMNYGPLLYNGGSSLGNSVYNQTLTWEGNTLSWFTEKNYQLNSSSKTYRYIAIG